MEKEKVFNNLENWLESLADMPPVEELWTKEAVFGENRTLRKTSVTRIIRHAENSLPGGKPEETMDDKRIPERFRRALLRYETEDLPAFMNEIPEEITAARRGTLTHRFLSLIPLEPLRENQEAISRVIREEKERMTARGVFTEEEAGEIREEWIVTGQPVRERWFYSMCLGRAFPVPESGQIPE